MWHGTLAALALADPRGFLTLGRTQVAIRPAARACEGCGAGDGESTPLQRFPASGGSSVAGLGCIPVPLERLLAPGAKRSMHLYDTSCMAVFAHAMARCGGRFAMAALDPAAAERRRFGLLPVACEVAVLSWGPSTHENKLGDVSTSIRAEVVGCGRLVVPESSAGLLQREPFVAVAASPFASVCPPASAAAAAARDCEACAGLSASVLRLRRRLGLEIADVDAWEEAVAQGGGVGGAEGWGGAKGEGVAEGVVGAQAPGPVSQAEPREPHNDAGLGSSTGRDGAGAAESKEDGVLSYLETRRWELQALAAARLLPGSERWAVLQQAELLPLLLETKRALKMEEARLAAMAAIADATAPPK